jgi:hypothetical protein
MKSHGSNKEAASALNIIHESKQNDTYGIVHDE